LQLIIKKFLLAMAVMQISGICVCYANFHTFSAALWLLMFMFIFFKLVAPCFLEGIWMK